MNFSTDFSYYQRPLKWKKASGAEEVEQLELKRAFGDVGYDLSYVPEYTDTENECSLLYEGAVVLVPTGLFLQLPFDPEWMWDVQVRPRSSTLLKRGIHVQFGTVDETYTSEIKLVCKNVGDFATWLQPGDRLAQLVITKVPRLLTPTRLSEPPSPNRGGFGSTGL